LKAVRKMGLGGTALGILLFIGVAKCDQSVYPSGSVGAPLTQEYADTSLVDNTAYYGQNDYSQGAYDYAQYSDTDRTAELIESALTIPLAIVAFFAALLGGILAPVVNEGFRALGEFEIPEIEFPRLKKTSSGRDYGEPYKPISSLFKLAAEKLITNSLERLQEAE